MIVNIIDADNKIHALEYKRLEYASLMELIINSYYTEIPVNVYDLGLIYDCKILAEDRVEILMTLTSPSCSMAEMIVEEVKERVSELDFVKEAIIELTWDPPWTKILMSDEALLLLGFM